MWLSHRELKEWETKLVDMSDEEFDVYMCTTYPNMFVHRHIKQGEGPILPMNFGFCIGAGWRHVLDTLCTRLKVLEDTFGVVCVFDQIKEKFGSARFYYHVTYTEEADLNLPLDNVNEIIEVLVNYYESYTEYVCEELGTNVNPDEKIVAGSWMYGCGIEGFTKRCNEMCKDKPEVAEERIKVAQKNLDWQNEIKDVRRNLCYLDEDGLNLVKDLIAKSKASKL